MRVSAHDQRFQLHGLQLKPARPGGKVTAVIAVVTVEVTVQQVLN
jgi:hypothetical protein